MMPAVIPTTSPICRISAAHWLETGLAAESAAARLNFKQGVAGRAAQLPRGLKLSQNRVRCQERSSGRSWRFWIWRVRDERNAKTNPLECRYTELKVENKPTLSAELLHFFMKAGGASPPSGADALRLSSAWHAGRQIRRATSAPASLLSRTGEGTLKELQKQTHSNAVTRS